MSTALPAFSARNTALAAALWLACAAGARAQDATPPPARVVGPQSVVERYDAPVPAAKPVEGLIDFPKLISEPGANDALSIATSLAALNLEILGTGGQDGPDEFVRITGTSRADEKRSRLYSALRAALAKYRELPLTLGDVRFIQQDITEAYAKQGYPLMSVVVPPQEIVAGTLRVQINEFRLAAYRVTYGDGHGGYSPTAPHRINDRRLANNLNSLLAESIATKAALDEQVQRLNTSPYRSARVVFEPGEQLGQTTAVFQIEEKRPWSVQAGYNNHATKASGTNRYSVGGAFGDLPFENQQLSWNATVGDRIDEFQNYSLIHTLPLGAEQKLTTNLNYSDTASSSIPGINSASTTLQASLTYDRPLITRDAYNLALSTTAALKKFERSSLFGGAVVGGAKFDSTQLTAAFTLNWKEAAATNQIVVSTVFSLAGLTSRNTDADFRAFYNSADGHATTQHFIFNYARVQQLKPLAAALAGWATETQLSGQLAAQTLGGGDDFSVGGPSALRAYQSSEAAGDEGGYVTQFLHAPAFTRAALGPLSTIVDKASLSLFAEIGYSHFRRGGDDRLWDYGIQAALAARGGFSANASLAHAGQAGNVTSRGETRFFLSVQFRY